MTFPRSAVLTWMRRRLTGARSIQHRTWRSSMGSTLTKAVISDFEFCRRALRPDGAVLFHDFSIVYPAIVRICKSLAAERVTHVPLKLEGNVFGIFFDPALIDGDPYLSALQTSNRHYLRSWLLKRGIERSLPLAVVKPLRWATGA